jgi:leucyl/phenylalanyl-tRNA--protein transferase
MRVKPFRVTVNKAFPEVIQSCGDREEGTWITDELFRGFCELHHLGWAHSVEVWNIHSGELVGGIYGLAVGSVFAGESMFHRRRTPPRWPLRRWRTGSTGPGSGCWTPSR